MAVTVIEALVSTIETGHTMFWTITGVDPPFNKGLSRKARPPRLVEWQAVPLLVEIGSDVLDRPVLERPHRELRNIKAGLQITTISVVQEDDTSISHIVPITCFDAGNAAPGMHFTVTYVLYAICTDVP